MNDKDVWLGEQLARIRRSASMERVDGILREVGDELRRALEKHPVGFRSAHEGYGVLIEEVDELFDEVKADDPIRQQKEAIQVAAMAVRFVLDVCPRVE